MFHSILSIFVIDRLFIFINILCLNFDATKIRGIICPLNRSFIRIFVALNFYLFSFRRHTLFLLPLLTLIYEKIAINYCKTMSLVNNIYIY